jgi:osmotically-inducible protein OsmY
LRRLRHSGYLALRDISCDVDGDGLSLHGRLPSYYLKQVAQALVAEVEGVERVVNMIKVSAPPRRMPSGHDRPSRGGDSPSVRRNLP